MSYQRNVSESEGFLEVGKRGRSEILLREGDRPNFGESEPRTVTSWRAVDANNLLSRRRL